MGSSADNPSIFQLTASLSCMRCHCRALPAEPFQCTEVKGDDFNAFTFSLNSLSVSADSCSSKDTFVWICKNHKCPNLHTPGKEFLRL